MRRLARCKHSNLVAEFKKSFFPFQLEAYLIKLFGVILLKLFCKLDLFTTLRQIWFTLIKWASLLNCMSKFMPKMFYEIDRWLFFIAKTNNYFSLVPCILVEYLLADRHFG